MKIYTLVLLLLSGIFSSSSTKASPLSPFSVKNVRIISFQATTDGQSTVINWVLAEMEHGVACHLERSADGIKYSPIESFKIAEGFSGKMSAVDKDVKPGLYFYRLHMEKPGYIPFFSTIASIRIVGSEDSQAMRLINPFRNAVTLKGKFSGNPLTVEVADMNGMIRLVTSVTPDPGMESISFDAAKLGKGVYIIRVKENTIDTQKIIMTKRIMKQVD
jgi:Secretion system C-terminal sorting domain